MKIGMGGRHLRIVGRHTLFDRGGYGVPPASGTSVSVKGTSTGLE